MQKIPKYLLYVICFFLSITIFVFPTQKPRIAVIMVVDQLAYHYIPKLTPFLQGGIKYLLQQGIVYTNAYYPHALPATATGHTALNTGTFAKDHGIIDNAWFDANGTKIQSDDDRAEHAAVFAPNGLYDYGKSARNIMVDGISDQLVLHSQPNNPINVVALALKSRAAISAAGKLGKAIWFDEKTGMFTSSKAYYQELPAWLTNFNEYMQQQLPNTITWHLLYPAESPAYQFNFINDYQWAAQPSLIDREIILNAALEENAHDQDKYLPLEKNPYANQLLFDLAQTCIDTYTTHHPTGTLLVWLCLSSLDLVGHDFGPNSLEVTDMIYRLDMQMLNFIKYVTRVAGDDALFILTADHGIEPMPEIVNAAGLHADRLYIEEKIPDLNAHLFETFGLENIVRAFQPNQLYLDKTMLMSLKPRQQKKVIKRIKNFLRELPGVKSVWDYRELAKSSFAPDALENYEKNQLYPGRSGDIIFQMLPYHLATTYKNGASHVSPYEGDTHVPLIVFQHNALERKTINEKVWTLQLANTLAQLFGVPKPSASTFAPLPGVIPSISNHMTPSVPKTRLKQ